MKRCVLIGKSDKTSGMLHLAKQLKADVLYGSSNPLSALFCLATAPDKIDDYDEVITMLHPYHLFGKDARKRGQKWIVYDAEVPPPEVFSSRLKRIYIRIFSWLNKNTMSGANEYWIFRTHPPKSRFNKKRDYAIYLGRTEEYKRVTWLKEICKKHGIPLVHPRNVPDEIVHALLSNARLLLTASKWEGFGMPVMEAQHLGIPVVCFNTGLHMKLVKNGSVVDTDEEFEKELKCWWKQDWNKGGKIC